MMLCRAVFCLVSLLLAFSGLLAQKQRDALAPKSTGENAPIRQQYIFVSFVVPALG